MKNEIEDLRRTIEQAQAERSIDALKKTIFGGAAILILFAVLVGAKTVDGSSSTQTASFRCSWTSGSSCQYSIRHHKLCAGTFHPASGAFDNCVRGFGSEPDFRIVDSLL